MPYNISIMNSRWYDENSETIKVLETLKNLDEASQEKVAAEIIEISNQIKALQREKADDMPLSLGIQRVLGLYQSAQKRRWYDQNEELSNAIKNMSTLPEQDFQNIMKGLFESLNS